MLRDFLVGLAVDSEALQKFQTNPDETMSHAGLSDEEQSAIRDGDTEHLRTLLAESAAPASEYEVWQSPNTPHCPVHQMAWQHATTIDLTPPPPFFHFKGLKIVGTGIRAGLQTTPEAKVYIRAAPKVLYLVADPISEALIQKLNPRAESLQPYYKNGEKRIDIYTEIVNKILSSLRELGDLCVVFYGHPSVLVYPAREAVRRARSEQFLARIVPGISAEDNLLADLGIDPGIVGIQSYEATTFLINKYQFDTSAGLILWQIGVLGDTRWNPGQRVGRARLQTLATYLGRYYGSDYHVFLYEAAELPTGNPKIQRVLLSQFPEAAIRGMSTLYLPPKAPRTVDNDMVNELQLEW